MESFTDHDGIRYSPSRVQLALLKFWKQMLAEVKTQARGHDLYLHLGGDLVDGVHHHGSTQTVGDVNDQRALAAQMLLPLATMSKRIYALLGTDAHVGQSGAEDKSVAKELGAEARHRWRMLSGGKVLDWAHHAGLGRKPWTQENAPASLANKIKAECDDRGQRRPDLVVRHHVHRFVKAHAKGIDVFTCPGWQAQSSFSRRLDPAELLSVGAVLWYPKNGGIVPLIYDWPDDPLVEVAD